jgi:hypothetical protein
MLAALLAVMEGLTAPQAGGVRHGACHRSPRTKRVAGDGLKVDAI